LCSANQYQIVCVKNIKSGIEQKVILRDAWFRDTVVTLGSIIHIVGSFDHNGICVVDNEHNFIVTNPDYLISATTVSDTVSCMRKAVLQERVKVTSDISKPMVYGNILHSLFQSGLEDMNFSTVNLYSHADRIIKNNIESLYILREDIPAATSYVQSKVTLLQDWAKLFLLEKPTVCKHLFFPW
jgi:DNA replication ATP-dependent helicase Dna2